MRTSDNCPSATLKQFSCHLLAQIRLIWRAEGAKSAKRCHKLKGKVWKIVKTLKTSREKEHKRAKAEEKSKLEQINNDNAAHALALTFNWTPLMRCQDFSNLWAKVLYYRAFPPGYPSAMAKCVLDYGEKLIITLRTNIFTTLRCEFFIERSFWAADNNALQYSRRTRKQRHELIRFARAYTSKVPIFEEINSHNRNPFISNHSFLFETLSAKKLSRKTCHGAHNPVSQLECSFTHRKRFIGLNLNSWCVIYENIFKAFCIWWACAKRNRVTNKKILLHNKRQKKRARKREGSRIWKQQCFENV